jgi:cyclopropane fatty-acyl-phospholipid synthase-like methyltransferase
VDWDETYTDVPLYFGEEPDPFLTELIVRLDRSRPVLDLGSGPGRNALYLAREGFVVHAVDPSGVATRALEETAVAERLLIDVWTGTFSDYTAPARIYGTILALGLIPVIDRVDADLLVARTRDWLAPGGIAVVTAFTTADPSYERFVEEGRVISKNSFALPDGEVRTFLEPDEAPTFFTDLEVLHHREGMGPEHRHGNNPPHRHAHVDLALQKRGQG